MYAFSIHPLAVLVAAVISFAIGSVWYSSAFFAPSWVRITGRTMEEKQQLGKLTRVINYALVFLSLIIVALVITFFQENLFIPTIGQAVAAGFWLWFVGVGVVTMVSTITEPRKTLGDSWKLFAITTGYWLVVFLVTSLVIFAMS